MQKVAELTEDDIKLAIDFWFYNRHHGVIESGKDIHFSVTQPDRPGDSPSVTARFEYRDDPGPNP